MSDSDNPAGCDAAANRPPAELTPAARVAERSGGMPPVHGRYFVLRENRWLETAPGRLELVPDSRYAIQAVVLLVLVALLGWMMVQCCLRFADQLFDPRMPIIMPMLPGFLMLGWGTVLIAIHLQRALERVILDRNSGRLEIRIGAVTWLNRALTDVLGVGVAASQKTTGEPLKEVNLWLAKGPPAQVNVRCSPGLEAETDAFAARLAAWLQVPVLDSPPVPPQDARKCSPPGMAGGRGSGPGLIETARDYGAGATAFYGLLIGIFNPWSPFDPSLALVGALAYGLAGGAWGALFAWLVSVTMSRTGRKLLVLLGSVVWLGLLSAIVWLIAHQLGPMFYPLLAIPAQIALCAGALGTGLKIVRRMA